MRAKPYHPLHCVQCVRDHKRQRGRRKESRCEAGSSQEGSSQRPPCGLDLRGALDGLLLNQYYFYSFRKNFFFFSLISRFKTLLGVVGGGLALTKVHVDELTSDLPCMLGWRKDGTPWEWVWIQGHKSSLPGVVVALGDLLCTAPSFYDRVGLLHLPCYTSGVTVSSVTNVLRMLALNCLLFIWPAQLCLYNEL